MGITPLGLTVTLTVSGQTHMQPYIYDIYMKMLDNRYRIDILSTIMSDMLWTLVFIRRGRQKITEVPKIRKVISTANPVPIFIKKIWRNSYRNTIIPPDSKWVYRWPGACQMRCTWWWGRTCRPPDRAGPWPVWPAVSHDIKLKSTNWRRHHLHIETDSSERGQCSQSASMAVRGMARAASRSETAKLIIRMFL